eukprot:TRINITY_DN6993_c0_g2_i2.p1 TRINITY_DN6993_c0_g2~~TRINITY_DN6993_c0_g2_i2.p1  ORF type:complete len:406 (+),score=97.88 TRINITY_DN6993_c0_g2_i2:345-1562(+)
MSGAVHRSILCLCDRIQKNSEAIAPNPSILYHNSISPLPCTLVKLKLLQLPERLQLFKDRDVFLLVQLEFQLEKQLQELNLKILYICNTDFGAFHFHGEIFICNKVTARNLAWQSADFGKIDCLMELCQQDLLEISVKSPFSTKIIVEPTDWPQQGTGAYFGISGTTRPIDCKRQDLIDEGVALDHVTVKGPRPELYMIAWLNQWQVVYDVDWKAQVLECLKRIGMNESDVVFRNVEMANVYNCCQNWSGLGTKISQNVAISSYSNSFLITAYAMVSHLLQGDEEGLTVGTLGICHSDMTKEVWDYVILGKHFPRDSKVPQNILDRLRSEMEYWHPLDEYYATKSSMPVTMCFTIMQHCFQNFFRDLSSIRKIGNGSIEECLMTSGAQQMQCEQLLLSHLNMEHI